jgi:DNA-binding winged helix-turn-helix (wHTH) protein
LKHGRPLIYRFGEFEVNPYTRQLLRAGRSVPIQPKPLDLLLYLIRERARVVPRDEILAEVWQGVRVEAQALGFALHAVRRAVGDDGNRQSVIRTVSRSGLQFVDRVEEVAAPLDASGETPRGVPFGARAFFGRERLMTVAQELLEGAEQGDARILLLSGEAGIGKTRALEQIAEVAEARGFRVFRSNCVEGEGAPAFWPWVQILRGAV